MEESIKVVDLVVEYTDNEGKKSKVAIVLNDQLSRHLGEILLIDDYLEKVKSLLTRP